MSDPQLQAATARAAETVYRGTPRDDREELPPRRPLAGWWDGYVRAWRPSTSWACIIVLLVHGAVIPLTQLARSQGISAPDALFYGALVLLLKLAHDRRVERQEGITS